MGQSRTIGRAAKIGWEKKGSPIGLPIDRRCDTRSGGTDPILSTQRFPRGRDPVGAILKKMAISFKENALRVADFSMGAILKKMAISFTENALRVADF